MARGLKVAIVGASGIGKHHAKWHHEAGNEVVGFLGRDEERCSTTAAALKSIFDFTGRAYWDIERLLTQERPNIVDICSPHDRHYEHAVRALEAGAHVLCEKPLVWSADLAPNAIMEQARALLALAEKKGRILGVCTQYATSLPHYYKLYEPERGAFEHPSQFYAEMETLARGQQRDTRDLWVDMGSHPLSLILAFMPEGRIDPASLNVQFNTHQAQIQFDFVDKHRCQCKIIVRDVVAGQPVRRFGVNDFIVDCSGRPDAQGVYRTVLQHKTKEFVGEDFMSLLVGQFDATVAGANTAPLVPGRLGVRNLELQLEILAQATQAAD